MKRNHPPPSNSAPVTWTWKDRPGGKSGLGLIAQDVRPILPELVLQGADKEHTLSVNYIGLLPVVIRAIQVQQATIMSLIIALMGFCGGLVMSAIKRDRGVKDYGAIIPGHGGIMDRIDSLCFAAPIFFHLTRYYFT